jgi:hypothetical protein
MLVVSSRFARAGWVRGVWSLGCPDLVDRGTAMRFARWVFRIAGVYSLVVLAPQDFVEEQVGRDYPPAVTHPEYFYVSLGVAVAWQVAFLLVARDPARYRP